MNKLVSINGSYPAGNGGTIDRERLVRAAVVKPALVNGSFSSMNSHGNNNGMNDLQSTNSSNKLFDQDDARLEALLEPEFIGSYSSKFKSSLQASNKPLNRRSRSSENLELLLSNDFDDRQKGVVKKQTELINTKTFTESGHGDQLKVRTVEASSESVESYDGSEHKNSMTNVNMDANDEKVGVLKNYRESKEAITAAKFEDPASDSESDDEFYRKLRAPLKQHQKKEKVHPNYAGHTVHNEITVPDLPEIEEIKDLNIEDDAYMEVIGHVMSVVGVLAVIKSANESMALNEESILFKEDKTVFGKIFEVFGPVKDPFYSVRFNNAKEIEQKEIRVGLPVFCCLSDFELTKVVFKTDLDNLKGSDASWLNDCEPPAAVLDYSDDEKEREARRNLQLERRARRENENGDLLEDDGEGAMDSPDDQETKAAKLDRKLTREKQKVNKTKAKGSQEKLIEGDSKKGAKVVRTNAMALKQPVTNGNETSSSRGGKGGNRERGAEKTDLPIDVLYMQKVRKEIPKNADGLVASNRVTNQSRLYENGSRQYDWPTELPARTSSSNPFDLEMRCDNFDRPPYRSDEFQFSRPFPDVPLNIPSETRNERIFGTESQSGSNASYGTSATTPGTSRGYTMPVAPSNYQGGFKPPTFNFNSSFDSYSPRSSSQNGGNPLFRFQSSHRSSPGMPVASRSIFSPGEPGSTRFSFSGTNDRHESWIGLGSLENLRNTNEYR